MTRICELLGVEYPIFSAPMGPDIAGPELVAAVSGAGGFGILQAQLAPPEILREQIRAIREQTSKPFGVNFLLQFPCDEGIRVCLEERVGALSFFWGDPAGYVERAHAAGAKVIYQTGLVSKAIDAARAGADIIIAQGCEAGGHVEGTVSTMVLVPRVVDAIGPVPVAAAGGIADARGVRAVLALGAEAAVLGTRFLASEEANAHPVYKRKVVEAGEADTVRTILFGYGWPNAPHRTLRTKFVEEWIGNEARGQESRRDEPLIGETTIAGRKYPVFRFVGFPPNRYAKGDIESMSLLAGQSVGLIPQIKPAREIVRELAEGIMKS